MTHDVDLATRFWRMVPDRPGDGCWTWSGHRNHKGYGRIMWLGKVRFAHRISLMLDGRDPGTLLALHHCDNPPCVRPDHLYVGTLAENSRDMLERNRSAWALLAYHPRGEKHHSARLTEGMVRDIRARYALGESQQRIADSLGLSQNCISKVCRRATWSHV